MFDMNTEFEKLDKKARNDREKYLNAEVTVENYNFPHIYLTEEEIEEFNKECEKCGIDLMVVSLTEYMNLNSTDKSYIIGEDESIEQRELRVDKAMNFLGKNYIKKEKEKEDDEKEENILMEKVNKYIGLKQRRIPDDNSDDEIDDKSNKSISMNRSYMSKSYNSKKSEKSDRSENIGNVKKNKYKKKKLNDNDSGKDENKKKLKKKKITKAGDKLTENFENYFRKIKETRQKQVEDKERRGPLIQEILEKSQNLTKQELKDFANHNGISLINDITLSEYDLSKKDTNQLDRILTDIDINSDVLKLNQDRPENIKKMKSRLEREKKNQERYLENKKLKEEKRKEKLNAAKKQNNNKINEDKKSEEKKEDKKSSDMSDSDSDSDEDSI